MEPIMLRRALRTLLIALVAGAARAAAHAKAANNFESNSSTHGQEAGGTDYQGQYASKYAGGFEKYMSTGNQGKGGNIPAFSQKYVGGHASMFEGYMNEPDNTTISSAGNAKAAQQQGGYQQYMQKYGGSHQGAGGNSSQQGGDYQQYMEKYAGSYQKYMHQGQGGGNATQQGGDYQKYMKQYAGDYQKYMKQGKGGGKGGQGGDYQQYMKQYAGQGGSDQKADNSSSDKSGGGGYQHYMQQYAGDYSQYMGGAGAGALQMYATAGAGGQKAGDYQQYVDNYAGDYKTYMGKGGAGDYAKYMKGDAGHNMSTPTLLLAETNSSSTDAANAYKQKYAGKYLPHGVNMTDKEAMANFYQKQYADAYMPHGINQSDHKAVAKFYQDKYAGDYTPHGVNKSDQKAVASWFQQKFSGGFDVSKYMPKGSGTASAPATALYSGFLPGSQREAAPETKSSKAEPETKASKAAVDTKASKESHGATDAAAPESQDKTRTAQSAAAVSRSVTGLRIPVLAFLSGLGVAMAASRVHAVRRRRLFGQQQERERSEELFYALMA